MHNIYSDNKNNTILIISSYLIYYLGIYNIAGKCYDHLDNIDCARKCYTTAVLVDPACLEPAETLVTYSHLSIPQKLSFFNKIDFSHRLWVRRYYQSLLLSDIDLTDSTVNPVGMSQSQSQSNNKSSNKPTKGNKPSSITTSTSKTPTGDHIIYDIPVMGITNLPSHNHQHKHTSSSSTNNTTTGGVLDETKLNSNRLTETINMASTLNTSSLIRLAEYL